MHLETTRGLRGQSLLSPQVRLHFSSVHFSPSAMQEGFIELLLLLVVVVVDATVVLLVSAAAVVV
jgi:hypothetical protein